MDPMMDPIDRIDEICGLLMEEAGYASDDEEGSKAPTEHSPYAQALIDEALKLASEAIDSLQQDEGHEVSSESITLALRTYAE
jgi:hypothetical protein